MTGYKIPFFHLSRQYDNLKDELLDATDQVLKSGQLVDGEKTKEFEGWLEYKTGMEHAVTCHSGTNALEIFARWYRDFYHFEPQRKPIAAIPTLTFPATANAFINTGWDIVFVDTNNCGQVTGDILDNLNTKYDLFVAVGLYGEVVDKNLYNGREIFEDAAQHWTSNNCQILGPMTAISFDPTKNLPASGNGGAILTVFGELADYAKAYRGHGKFNGVHVGPGSNSRMSEIDASHLLVRSRYLDGWESRRHDIAMYYIDQLNGYNGIRTLAMNPKTHAFQKFVISFPSNEIRNRVRFKLQEEGIQTRIHYNKPLHEMPYNDSYIGPGIISTASSLTRTILSLPIYPELTDAEVEIIVTQVRRYVDKQNIHVTTPNHNSI